MTRDELARAKEIEKLLFEYEKLLDFIHRPGYKLLLGYRDTDPNNWLCDDFVVKDIKNNIGSALEARISQLQREMSAI